MTILIARHGVTEDNANGIIQLPGTALSAEGNKQARLLGARLKDFEITRIISSDYLRARETAWHVAFACNLSVQFNSQLRERNFGDLRGKSYTDIEVDPFDPEFSPSNGENALVFQTRVSKAWLEITEQAAQTEGNVLVITHGFVLRSLIQRHFTIPTKLASESEIGNTALSMVSKAKPWTADLLNCTAHLEQVLSPAANPSRQT